MIEILPMEDRQREKELLEGLETGDGEPRVLMMADRGEELGWAAVELAGNTLQLLKLSAGDYDFSRKPALEETFVLDTLLRSAASYGETFGADLFETVFPDFYGFFRARGFESDETHAFGPISVIVKYE